MRVVTCSSNPNLLQRQSGTSSSALHSCKPCINPLTAGLQHSPLVRPQPQRSSWSTARRPHQTVLHTEALSSSGISGITGGSSSQRKPAYTGNGTFWLLAINLAIYLADHVLHVSQVPAFYLYHMSPRWWQFLTSAFCHHDFNHLSSNAFMLYVFGRIVEEEEGAPGVWGTYLVCALGASVASFFLASRSTVSLGASGAVFGLFSMAVLSKFRLHPKKLMECAVLGQFVIKQLVQEAHLQAAGWGKASLPGGVQIGHVAHLAGALAGVVLVILLSRIPAAS